MKKSILISAAAIMMAAAGFAQSDKAISGILTIKGNFTDVKDTLVLVGIDFGSPRGNKITDLVTKNGKFEYKVQLDKPKNIAFYRPFGQQKGKSMVESGSIPAIPGETVELKGTVVNNQMKGTGFYKQYANLHNLVKGFYQTIYSESEKYAAKIKDTQDEKVKKEAAEAYETNMNVAKEKLNTELTTYLNEHKNEEATAFVASYLDPSKLDKVMKTLDPNIVNGRLAGVFDAVKARLKAQELQEEAEKAVQAGKMAPDFTLKDIHGKDFSLSSLRGKYVVLDFWGSWCGWCIKGMPEMKKYYEKYKGKFEIVGVDCQDTEAKWKAAVEKHQLPWIHVKNETKNLTPEKYAVTGYPTKVLINPDGTINKIIVGEDPEFYKYLDSLFENK